MRVLLKYARWLFFAQVALASCFFIFRPYGVVARATSHLLVFPAAIVDGCWVFYHRIASFAVEEKNFDRGVARALYDARVRNIARELNVEVEDVSMAILRSQEHQTVSRDKLVAIEKRIDSDGMPFIDAARYFSEHVSAIDSGELGVITVATMPTWMASAVVNLKTGEKTSIVESPQAFWLFRVTDMGGEGAGAWMRLRGIAVNKQTLEDAITQDVKDHPAFVFVW
jgi:hypothetical protein